MKCKFSPQARYKVAILGLIEAYWNVNQWGGGHEHNACVGLIEAYWNVNITCTELWNEQEFRFNRSILKCK